jgi:hypothetical protein
MSRVLTLTGALLFVLFVAVPCTVDAQAASGAPAQAPAPPPPSVKVGEPMPDFALSYLEPAPDGGRPQPRTARLSDFKGKQVVVLAFFPAAFSPG